MDNLETQGTPILRVKAFLYPLVNNVGGCFSGREVRLFGGYLRVLQEIPV